MFNLFKSGKNKLAIGMLAVVMTLSLSVVAQGASTANGTNIRFRSEPILEDKYIIRELAKDEQVNILDVNGEWLKVEVSGVVGYVNSKFIKIDEKQNATIIDGPTKIRTTPSLANEANVVQDVRLKAGDRIYVMSQAGNFYCIEFNNQVYYVHTTLVLLDANKEQVEQEQQITDEIIAQSVQEETQEEIIEVVEEVKSITTETISSSEFAIGETVYSLVNNLNFRTEMNTSNNSKNGYVFAGQPLTILEIYPDWFKVSKTSGETGYVFRQYVTKSQGNYGVVDQARMLLGIPYAQYYNNVSIDCSGLVYYVYHVLNGVSIPRCSYEQARVANYKEAYEIANQEDLMPGDLVFFYGGCSHVGLYIGNGEFIQAENYGYNSRVTKFYGDSIDCDHWGKNFTKGVRIIK